MVFHDITMPRLTEWMRFLSARLRHVRILAGDWSRLVTTGAMITLSVRQGGGHAGVFLDPPYAHAHRNSTDLYPYESAAIADDVRAWCLANGADPRRRIVLAGYDTEHGELEAHGWTVTEWFREGWIKGGMGSDAHRERLWLSPHCERPGTEPQMGLWE